MKDQRADRDAERLRRVLERATPADADGSVGRTDSVRKRARRQQRRNQLTVTLLVVAVAVVVLVPQLLNRARTAHLEPAGPAASGSATSAAQSGSDPLEADPLAVNPCPADPVDVGAATGQGFSSDGVVSVRLCAAFGAINAWSWRPPADALVTGVEAFAESLAAAPPADPHRCDAVRPLFDPFALLVAYPAGRTKTVPVTSSCSDIVVDRNAVASPMVLDSFLGALAEQRRRLEPPDDLSLRAGCPREIVRSIRDSRLIDERLDVRSAALCRVDNLDGFVSSRLVDRLGAAEVAVVAADMERNVQRRGPFGLWCERLRGRWEFQVVTAWGDVHTFEDPSRRCGGPGEWSGSGYTWRPGSAAYDIIADKLSE